MDIVERRYHARFCLPSGPYFPDFDDYHTSSVGVLRPRQTCPARRPGYARGSTLATRFIYGRI